MYSNTPDLDQNDKGQRWKGRYCVERAQGGLLQPGGNQRLSRAGKSVKSALPINLSELDRSGTLSPSFSNTVVRCHPSCRPVEPAWGRRHDRLALPCARRAPFSRFPFAQSASPCLPPPPASEPSLLGLKPPPAPPVCGGTIIISPWSSPLRTGLSSPCGVIQIDWLFVTRERAFTCSSLCRARACSSALSPVLPRPSTPPPVWTAVKGCQAVRVTPASRPSLPAAASLRTPGNRGAALPMPTGAAVNTPRSIHRIQTPEGNSSDCRTGSARERRLSLGQVP
ncbi:hypothetical protein FQA47_002021 [Oryzias melastigma]|uniref:Uncharacterized protein n=1 Tax=Oryzias melastigma TaxID=30732 RepID=A0A834FA73_ORYME|nr:hypothetical protein FQA47_002021 [Oryzias melastigma]